MRQTDFSELLTRYLTHYLPIQRNLSGNTIRSYRDTFKLLLTFCRDEKKLNISKLKLKQLDKSCIEDFFLWLQKSKNVSPSTYNQRLCAIHAFFNYVMTEEPEYMEHCTKILKIRNLKTPDRNAKYLTSDNLKQILSAVDTSTKQGRRHLTLLTVLYDTAARVNELCDICVRDVRMDTPASITLHGKGGMIRTVPLMMQTTELLKKYFAENRIDQHIHCDMPLFCNTRKQKLTRSGITYIVQKYADAAKPDSLEATVKLTPHIFRHTKAMHLVQANVNPIYIRDYLGHKNITTTEIYARADNEMKRTALEKAAEQFDLPKPSDWENDSELLEWISSL